MYRVMLIDDEDSARNLMKKSIDWESLEMSVAGEAASGIEAINIIDDVKPDLCFVDISMPFMNGIEFTKLATQRYPELIIIIMTAFDEFEYARQCIRLPVFDYMLKPIVRAEVTETLTKAKNVLDQKVPKEDINEEIEENTFESIKKYIEDNYTNPDINLTSVSQHFGFSSSYLCRRFKQEAGQNFVEFLTDCRMKKAMQLALENVKMFYASKTVGIPDPNYFGRIFKKYTGVSYSEYGQKMRDKQEA